MNSSDKGKAGEDAVCAELIRRGHKLICRNYRKRCGEIDIISECGGFIVFTEVKSRRNNSLFDGASAIDANKQRKLILTADKWLCENNCGLQPRFDAAVVYLSHGELSRVVRVDITEGAFSADDVYTAN